MVMKDIINNVCAALNLPVHLVVSKSRQSELVEARAMIAGIACNVHGEIQEVVARHLNRDRTTVSAMLKSHDSLMATPGTRYERYRAVYNRLEAESGYSVAAVPPPDIFAAWDSAKKTKQKALSQVSRARHAASQAKEAARIAELAADRASRAVDRAVKILIECSPTVNID